MGATGLHPVMEIQETLSGAKAPSPGAREIETQFGELEAATPQRVLKFADRDAAVAPSRRWPPRASTWRSWPDAPGGWPRIRCSSPADPVVAGGLARQGPVAGLAEQDGSRAGRAAGLDGGFDGPPELRAAYAVAAKGEAFAKVASFLDFRRFEPARRRG
jgi:hypothetical protein